MTTEVPIDAPNNSGIVFTPGRTPPAGEARLGESLCAEDRRPALHTESRPISRASSAELDTAFLATTSAESAPYIQHRGGPKGFIKVLDDKTLGFADFAGNKQYITISNLAGNDRAYLFLLDFANRQRIKIWGRARVVENDPALMERLVEPGYRARPERAILFTIEAWDMQLLAAHHRAVHPGRSHRSVRRIARSRRGPGGGKRPAPSGVGSGLGAINSRSRIAAGKICNPKCYRTVLLSQLSPMWRVVFAAHYYACACG